ncbi:MAG: CarD family transcriptional regulator, partial [Planctomycetota bacterium]
METDVEFASYTPGQYDLSMIPAAAIAAISNRERFASWEPGKPIWAADVWSTVRGLFAAMLASGSLPHQGDFSPTPGVILGIVPDAVDMDIVAGDAATFSRGRDAQVAETMAFPLSSSLDSTSGVHDAAFASRLQVLQRLRKIETAIEQDGGVAKPLIITASVGSILQAVPGRDEVAAATRDLVVGGTLDDAEMRRWLSEAGFQPTTAVQLPGEFCQRGGIIDVFSPDQSSPVRIELFDDEIESIRRFDPASQRSVEQLQRLEIAAISGAPPETQVSLVDYLPDESMVVMYDPLQCQKAADVLLGRLKDSSNYLTFAELNVAISRLRLVFATQLSGGDKSDTVGLRVTGVESFVGAIDQVCEKVDTIAQDHEVVVVGDTPADAERLSEILRPTKAATSGKLHLTVGELSGGFRLHAAETLLLTGAELFQRSPLRRGKTRAPGKPIDSFLQLSTGDLVVHLAHGIGLYRGLEHLEKNGQSQEHLVLEFDSGTTVYVPTTRIGLVQKYVGGGNSKPKLAKIGGQTWAKNRKAAQSAVADMASELLEIQAKRASRVGNAFPPDNAWQQSFDASFPYTETADQITAIDAVKDDMESTRPMDRLICGDVGFGKTEVAMRAAFKAVVSGYQVAMMVPTTVLAEQHFQSFQRRMAEFPIEIAKLSRFCSPAELRETVKQ